MATIRIPAGCNLAATADDLTAASAILVAEWSPVRG
jgi:hypothetical protein